MKLILVTALLFAPLAALRAADVPQQAPESPIMLAGPWLPENPQQLDFQALPKLPSEHAVISDVSAKKGANQHNYLAHHDGQF